MNVIKFNEIANCVPRRVDCLDSNQYNIVNDTIKSGKELVFMPDYIEDIDVKRKSENGAVSDYKYAKKYYNIAIYGYLSDGRNATVVMTNIKPYLEIVVPPESNPEEFLEEVEDYLRGETITYSNSDHPTPLYSMIDGDMQIVTGRWYRDLTCEYSFIRIEFRTISNRKTIFKALEDKYKTAADDDKDYFHVVAREQMLQFGSWLTLKSWHTYSAAGKHPLFPNTCVVELDYTNVGNFTGDMFNDARIMRDKCMIMAYDLETHMLEPHPGVPMPDGEKDGMSVCGLAFKWQHMCVESDDESRQDELALERYKELLESNNFDYDAANAQLQTEYPKQSRNLNVMQHKSTDSAIYRCALVVVPEEYDATKIPWNGYYGDWIVCKNERELVQGFLEIIKRMQPNWIIDFNGGGYDRKWFMYGFHKYGLVQKALDILSWRKIEYDFSKSYSGYSPYGSKDKQIWEKYSFYETRQIKIEKDTTPMEIYYKLPGPSWVDMKIGMHKIYKAAESTSLKYFLNKCDLPSKKSMDHDNMQMLFRKLYRHNNKSSSKDDQYSEQETFEMMYDYAKVVIYCIRDCTACTDMIRVKNLVSDYREYANITNTAVMTSYAKADGVRVVNTIAREYKLKNIHMTSRRNRNASAGFPGALILQPKLSGDIIPRPNLSLVVKNMRDLMARLDSGNLYNPANITPACIRKPEVYLIAKSLEEDYNKKINRAKLITELTDSEIDEVRRFINDAGLEFAKISDEMRKSILNFNSRQQALIDEYYAAPLYAPVAALDFSSLYPSIMMQWNLSLEYLIKDPAKKKELAKKNNWKFNKLEFETAGFAETKTAYTLHHENAIDKSDPAYKFGTVPQILYDLKDARKKIKKDMAKFEADMKSETDPDRIMIHKQKFEYCNIKQNTVKVLMNTFYGANGEASSCIFDEAIAGTVTHKGRYLLRNTINFLETVLGHNVIYGDTDSCYILFDNNNYTDIHQEYFNEMFDEYEYRKRLIIRCISVLESVEDAVNNHYFEKFGNRLVQMAGEGCKFPMSFYGIKKRYAYYEHEDPRPEKIKVIGSLKNRGMSFKKRDAVEFVKKLLPGLENKVFGLGNNLKRFEIALITIQDIYKRAFTVDEVACSSMWRDNDNVAMSTFVNRMRKQGMPPGKFERFNYVIVKKEQVMNENGKFVKLKKGDCMEFAGYAKEQGMDPDTDYYVRKRILGDLSRFIDGLPEFQLRLDENQRFEDILRDAFDDKNENGQERLKKFRDKSNKLARSYLMALCDCITNVGQHKANIVKNSKIANSLVMTTFADNFGSDLMSLVNKSNRSGEPRLPTTELQKLVGSIVRRAKTEAAEIVGMDRKSRYNNDHDAFGVFKRYGTINDIIGNNINITYGGGKTIKLLNTTKRVANIFGITAKRPPVVDLIESANALVEEKSKMIFEYITQLRTRFTLANIENSLKAKIWNSIGLIGDDNSDKLDECQEMIMREFDHIELYQIKECLSDIYVAFMNVFTITERICRAYDYVKNKRQVKVEDINPYTFDD